MAEEKPKKLKMSQRLYKRITFIAMGVVGALAAVATALMNFFSLSMDIFLGRGEAEVTENPAMEGADASYYEPTGSDDAVSATDAAALAVAQEGDVLLKNEGGVLPLARGASVTPFGYRYIEPVYSGGGSGGVNTSSSRMVTAQATIAKYFTTNPEVEEALAGATPQGLDNTGYTQPQDEGGFEGGALTIVEFDPSIYSGHEASMAGTTGVVFIGRPGHEGGDIYAPVPGSPLLDSPYADGTQHQLALSEYEKDMLRIAKQNCDKVVVVLQCGNAMQIADLVNPDSDLSADAILWIGNPGTIGMEAMGQILTGEVNPSGRTVDTWPVDLMSDPSMKNFGNYEYKDLYLLTGGFPNPVGDPTEMNYLEYEEGIYVGYRYYETVDDTNGTFTVAGETGKSYDEAVLFPFGYGLSYGADFSQSIADVSETDDEITVTVSVTNNGTAAAKDVVQLYVNPPYTDFDAQNGIEKATVNLVAFDKTDDIEPGGTQQVVLTVQKEDLASYSYRQENSDGTQGAYLLEAGDYVMSVNANAHEEYDSFTITIDSDVWYDSSNPRQSEVTAQAMLDEEGNPTGATKAEAGGYGTGTIAAHNLFDDMTEHMAGTDQMTRANGALVDTTTSPTDEEMAQIPEGFYYTTDSDGTMTLQQMDLSTNEELGNVEGSLVYTTDMPTTGAQRVMSLSDLRGVDYFDPAWDTLLDQIDLTDSGLYLALAASYDQTAAIEAVSKPATVDFDGPQGIVGSITDATEYMGFPSEPVVASTFNVRCGRALGDSVGREAMANGVNGWYAPAVNIHRSPFSGRNFEYYSEDPVLSGNMAANVIEGCASEGLVTTVKHFALNDEECYDNDRSRVSIWANEQAIREIYLKPFEIAVKKPMMDLAYLDENGQQQTKRMRATTGVMGCMNYWGTRWGGADWWLLTGVLRHEWGFEGAVITDMVMNAGSNSVDQCLRSGSDTWMAWGDAFTSLINDHESATGVSTIRRCVKNMCYTVANSYAMNGMTPGAKVTYATSPWRIGLAAGDIAAVGIITGLGVALYRRGKDVEAHPENYKADKPKKAEKDRVEQG